MLTFIPEKLFIPAQSAPTRQDAESIAPWAAEIISVDGGWMAFKLESDANRWQAQE